MMMVGVPRKKEEDVDRNEREQQAVNAEREELHQSLSVEPTKANTFHYYPHH